MHKPLLLSLCSPAPGSGKSTVASHLFNVHDFVVLKFAGPLKDMVRALLRSAGIDRVMTERYVDGDLKETVIPEIGVTPRWLCQSLGTEWGRNLIRSDLWLHIVEQRVASHLDAGFDVVIDDMRFFNEFEMVHRLGGVAVRVRRPGCGVAVDHPSEGALDHVEMCELVNDGSRADLRLDVDRLLSDLLG